MHIVSIIITTKNEERNIEACLKSIKRQTYKNIEIIVVDNNSTDKTQLISKKYTSNVFSIGPERSAQRNFGAKKAKGKYVLFLDADMILTPSVVSECVKKMSSEVKTNWGGVIIPEISFGVGFWAQVKSFERSFYINNDSVEAARFYDKKIFNEIGGFDEAITGPEDWDFSQRVEKVYHIARIRAAIRHNEGQLSLRQTLKKKYYYAKKYAVYEQKDKENRQKEFIVLDRYKLFFSQPLKLLKNPFLSTAMLFMKTAEFGAGALAYLSTKSSK